MPDDDTRREAASLADTRLTEKDAERYAGITAGLKVDPDRVDPDAAARG